MNFRTYRTLLTLGAIALLTPANARAVDTQERSSLRASSAAEALSSMSVETRLAEPGVPGGTEAAFTTIVSTLNASGQPRIAIGPNGMQNWDDLGVLALSPSGDWSLRVHDDGSFQFFANVFDETALTKDLQYPEPSDLDIESVGLSFIQNALSPLVPLAPNEEVVLLGIDSLQRWVDDGKRQGEEIAVLAFFGRKIDNVHVVGPGSKISLLLSRSLDIIGVDVDWPVYRKSSSVGTVSIEKVFDRAEKIRSIAAADLQAGTSIVECGLYDPGYGLRGNVPLQPGCLLFVDTRVDPAGPEDELMAIPLGEDVDIDCNWPETTALAFVPWEPCGLLGSILDFWEPN